MRQYILSYQPENIESLSNGLFRIYYGIEKSSETITHKDEEGHETSETHDIWICKGVDIAGPISAAVYATLVGTIIRNEYTLDDELALHRQRETKVAEWTAYNTFCEDTKTFAKDLLGIN